MDKFPYEDIIMLPYSGIKNKEHMSLYERAAQFSAFRALTGFEEAVVEKSRHTERKIEIDDDLKTDINLKLTVLSNSLDNMPDVSITYFLKDKKKQGGKYVTKSGIIASVNDFKKLVVMADGAEIPIENILFIESELTDSLF